MGTGPELVSNQAVPVSLVQIDIRSSRWAIGSSQEAGYRSESS